jgi:hypothetical protein
LTQQCIVTICAFLLSTPGTVLLVVNLEWMFLRAWGGLMSFWLMFIPGSSCFPVSGISIWELDQIVAVVTVVVIMVTRIVAWDVSRAKRSEIAWIFSKRRRQAATAESVELQATA